MGSVAYMQETGEVSSIGCLGLSQIPIRYWRCRDLNKRGGYGKIYPQSRVISLCMQAWKKVIREIYLPNELATKLGAADITLSRDVKEQVNPAGMTPSLPVKTIKRSQEEEPHKVPTLASPKLKIEQPKR